MHPGVDIRKATIIQSRIDFAMAVEGEIAELRVCHISYALKRLLNHRANSDVTGGYIVVNAERLRGPVELVAARILELANAK